MSMNCPETFHKHGKQINMPDGNGIFAKDRTYLRLFWADNATVPSNAISGYAPGCLYILTSGAIYVNKGTGASAVWHSVNTTAV